MMKKKYFVNRISYLTGNSIPVAAASQPRGKFVEYSEGGKLPTIALFSSRGEAMRNLGLGSHIMDNMRSFVLCAEVD